MHMSSQWYHCSKWNQERPWTSLKLKSELYLRFLAPYKSPGDVWSARQDKIHTYGTQCCTVDTSTMFSFLFFFFNESAKHVVALHQSQFRVKETPTVKLGLISLHPSAPLQCAGGVQRFLVCHALVEVILQRYIQWLPSSFPPRISYVQINSRPKWHKKMPLHMNGQLPISLSMCCPCWVENLFWTL